MKSLLLGLALAVTAWAQTSIFTSQIPVLDVDPSETPVNLGLRFTTATAGNITGARFYKGDATNGGTHTARLWNYDTATLLGTATFSGETSSGWQSVSFSPAIAITTGVTYMISVWMPEGHFSKTNTAFGSPITNAPLTANATSDGGNGFYTYDGATVMPSNNTGANYFVDVIWEASGGGGGGADSRRIVISRRIHAREENLPCG